MIRFSELLRGQVEEEIPYDTLKNLLRALSAHHPQYPRGSACVLSQTQTPVGSQLSQAICTFGNATSVRRTGDSGGLQPRALFRDTESAEPGATAEGDVGRLIESGERGCAVGAGDDAELQRVLRIVRDTPRLAWQHAHLVGRSINGAVQYLAERVELTANGGEVYVRDVRQFFGGICKQVCEFLATVCDGAFGDDDVLAAAAELSHPHPAFRSVEVFYSVEFWALAWNDFLSQRACLSLDDTFV